MSLKIFYSINIKFLLQIATQAISYGRDAALDLQMLEPIITVAKDDSALASSLYSTQNFFGIRQHISVIGNMTLNNPLVDLVSSVRNKRQNEKRVEDVIKAPYMDLIYGDTNVLPSEAAAAIP